MQMYQHCVIRFTILTKITATVTYTTRIYRAIHVWNASVFCRLWSSCRIMCGHQQLRVIFKKKNKLGELTFTAICVNMQAHSSILRCLAIELSFILARTLEQFFIKRRLHESRGILRKCLTLVCWRQTGVKENSNWNFYTDYFLDDDVKLL